MATKAQLFLGSTLSFNSQSVGEVLSVSGTFMTRNKTAVLTCDSTNGVAEQLQGSGQPGDLNVTCIYDPTAAGAYNDLMAAIAAGTEGAIAFTYPDGTSLGGASGCLLDLGIPSAGGPDDSLTVDLTLAVLTATGWAYTDLV